MTKKSGFNQMFANTQESFKLDKDERYFQYEIGKDFPVRHYITQKFGLMPTYLHSDDSFNEKIFDFLTEKAQLLSFTTNGKLKNLRKNARSFRGGTFWFLYKEYCFIAITVKDQNEDDEHFWQEKTPENNHKKLYHLSMVIPTGKEYPLEDFEPFITKPKGAKIHLLIKSYDEISFEPLNVRVPKNMDLALNYGKDFLEVYDIIKTRLSENSNGLYMFHGDPGTGKSSLIKYMAGDIDREFIYIPTAMLETFTTDPSSLQLLVQKPNAVMVLEDAEKLIMKRQGDGQDSSAISALLNMTDGILSDILNISIILTYNCDTELIDTALRRKGRLQMDYRFELLSIADARLLGASLKFTNEMLDSIIKPISLADVFNMNKKVQFAKIKETQRIGF